MIVLASQSPRRRELLEQICVPHSAVAVDIDESRLGDEPIAAQVRRLALEKAKAGRELNPQSWVLGADTLVVLDDEPLGKPHDQQHGVEGLMRLSGRVHQVMTAVALVGEGFERCLLSQSEVHFRPLTRAQAEWYWNTGEPADKAGGYAVQGLGALFISHISGSYSGIMGLPLYETSQLLREAGLAEELWRDQ